MSLETDHFIVLKTFVHDGMELNLLMVSLIHDVEIRKDDDGKEYMSGEALILCERIANYCDSTPYIHWRVETKNRELTDNFYLGSYHKTIHEAYESFQKRKDESEALLFTRLKRREELKAESH